MKEKGPRAGGEEIDQRSGAVCKESTKKHNTTSINLPRNLSYSDESDVECSSEDDNDQFTQDTTNLHSSKPKPTKATNELNRQFENISLYENGSLIVNEEALKRFSALPLNEKYEKVLEIILLLFGKSSAHTNYEDKDLKARSPFRNRVALQSQHKQTPFDRPDLTVNSLLGNGGNVYVQKPSVNIRQPCIIPKPVSSLSVERVPQEDDYLKWLNDPIFYQDFLKNMEQMFMTIGTSGTRLEVPSLESIEQSLVSPMMTSPITSPLTDQYDSSYETGSPGSTVGASPAARTSISSDSDLELDPAMEHRSLPSNIVFVPALRLPQPQPCTSNRLTPSIKTEPDVKPLGEIVNFVRTSATQRLDDLSKSTTFCEKHYAIQLVKVVLISEAKTVDAKVKGFSKSLLETMKVKPSKANDSDIWQLSLYAHIEFLTAKDRMQEYRPTLLSRDEQYHSLLYIAAVERYEKPLIARYVVESMAKVGYPNEIYEDGNNILHVLANLGDTHKDVMSELLMATGADGKPLLDVAATNAVGQSALHVAVLSPHQHISIVLLLLRMNANPFQEDSYNKTPLYYHMINSAKQEPRNGRDLEVIRKMIQAQPLYTKEALKTLEDLCADSYYPTDLTAVIKREISCCAKEVKAKKSERR